jgi:hypothetical protein
VTGECATCTTDGRKGYCAKGRCYCGHPTCQGFASWAPLAEPVLETAPRKPSRASSWDTREESTWIDQL